MTPDNSPSPDGEFAVVVFFAAPLPTKRHSLKRLIRASLKRPSFGRQLFLARLIWLIQGRRIDHTTIGDGWGVLDPALTGDRYWPWDTFIQNYPGLNSWFLLPVPHNPELHNHINTSPRRALPSIIKWLTRRRRNSRDCVDSVAAALDRAGLPVPRSVITVPDLEQWLYEQQRATRTVL